jgi:hypothetical protein
MGKTTSRFSGAMQRQWNGIRKPDHMLREARIMRSLHSQDDGWIPGSDPLALLGPGNTQRLGVHSVILALVARTHAFATLGKACVVGTSPTMTVGLRHA